MSKALASTSSAFAGSTPLRRRPAVRAASRGSICAIGDSRVSGIGGSSSVVGSTMDTMPTRRFVLAFVVIALVSSACIWSNDDEQPSPTPSSSPTGSLLPSTPDALPTMDAEDFHSMVDQLGGTPLVVNVWASWCEPCERETPMLTAAAADHPGVRFVGV